MIVLPARFHVEQPLGRAGQAAARRRGPRPRCRTGSSNRARSSASSDGIRPAVAGPTGTSSIGSPVTRLAARDDRRSGEVAGHVERGAAHVEEAVDAEHQADALGRHPDHAEDQRDHRQRARRNAGGADAAEDADQQHHRLLRRGSARRRRIGRGTARSRLRRSRCRSGWRWRRWSARSATRAAAGCSLFSATRSAVGSVAFDEAVEKAITIASWLWRKNHDRRHPAGELEQQRIDDEHLHAEREQHDRRHRRRGGAAGPSRTPRRG